MLLFLMAGVSPSFLNQGSYSESQRVFDGRFFGFWLFGCGRLLEGSIAEGRLLKGGK
jgi:hypothetical protein